MPNNESNNNNNNNNNNDRNRDSFNGDEESKKRFIDESKETNDDSQRAPKRLRVSQPDVIVKVGDQEYEHYSVLLCAASPYFDTMLSIDMRERLSGRIEFVDKDPNDWEALLPFLEPHAPSLTLPTIQQLLPWFHQLQMERLLEESDQFLKKKVQETRDAKSKSDVHEFIFILELSDKFSLQASREAALDFLEDCVRKGNIILGSDGVSRLIPFLRARPTLWDAMKKHLPEEFRHGNNEELLQNPLFSFVVSARWRLRSKQKEARRTTSSTARIGVRRLAAGIPPMQIQQPDGIPNGNMAPHVQEAVAAAVEHIQRELDQVERQIA